MYSIWLFISTGICSCILLQQLDCCDQVDSILLCIWEVYCSNLGLKKIGPDRFSWISSTPQTNSRIVSQITITVTPRSLPSTSIQIHYSLIILTFTATLSELLTELLNKPRRNKEQCNTTQREKYHVLLIDVFVIIIQPQNFRMWLFIIVKEGSPLSPYE